MTAILGKRKRRKQIAEAESQPSFEDEGHGEQVQSLLRQYFETTFEPLESSTPVVAPASPVQDDYDIGDASSTEWSGLSEDEEKGAIVVDYQKLPSTNLDVSREDMKNFMVSRSVYSSQICSDTDARALKVFKTAFAPGQTAYHSQEKRT